MKSILLAHAARYPSMEPTDAVKLIYQNEFGGGHLIRNEQKCLDYLQTEYQSVAPIPGIPLLEDIGNDFFRVNLAALDTSGITPLELGLVFIRSAACHHGTLPSFIEKLSILKELTLSGAMPFPPEALDIYLADYEKAGFPPVSHSETYRNAYHPVYRVVHADDLPEPFLQQML